MIAKAYSFSDEDNRLLANCGAAATWDDERLKALKISIKQHYLAQQDFTCAFCQQRMVVKHSMQWDVEHVIARSQRPEFTFVAENLCVSCKDCNTSKSDAKVISGTKSKRFPKKSESYSIIHPHFDKYEEHMTVLVPGLVYRWRTFKGRQTITVYGLQRFLKDAGQTGGSMASLDARRRCARITAGLSDEDRAIEEKQLLTYLLMKHADKSKGRQVMEIIQTLE